MSRSNYERGASNTTLIITLIVLALGITLVIKIGPVYHNKKALQITLDKFLSAEAMRMDRDELIQAVIQAGKDAGVELTQKNVKLKYAPEGNKLTITVKYTANANLIVTKYKKDMEIVSVSPIWLIEDRVQENTDFSTNTPSTPPAPPGSYHTGKARDVGKKLNQ